MEDRQRSIHPILRARRGTASVTVSVRGLQSGTGVHSGHAREAGNSSTAERELAPNLSQHCRESKTPLS